MKRRAPSPGAWKSWMSRWRLVGGVAALNSKRRTFSVALPLAPALAGGARQPLSCVAALTTCTRRFWMRSCRVKMTTRIAGSALYLVTQDPREGGMGLQQEGLRLGLEPASCPVSWREGGGLVVCRRHRGEAHAAGRGD